MDERTLFLLEKVERRFEPFDCSKENFGIKDLGELSYCLGLNVIRDGQKIVVNQKRYIMDTLNRFNMIYITVIIWMLLMFHIRL